MPNPEISMSNSTTQSKKGGQTVLWWIAWIVLTIGSFFVAAAFWTPIIAKKVGSIYESKAAVWWVAAVFGTWLVFLIPLIIVMYHKVDKAYEDARIRREQAANRFRTILVEKSKRLLPTEIARKLASIPETIEGGHLATAILKNGERIPNVFIANKSEILGVYNVKEFSFEGKDVAELEVNDLSKPPFFVAANWLRLDGVQPQ
jgi:hypothetical protein